MNWRFLNTGFRSGNFNMEFDEFLAARLQEGTGSPTLRVYGWKPHAISIGFNQNIEDFDTTKLRDAGIDIVRRPTGGRAILHAHELTYSVVMNTNNQGPRAIYKFINEGLLYGLHILGINAELTSNDDNFRELYRTPSAIPCFASSAKSEIHVAGKKLVGSAQRRFGNVILQHGSLLLGPQHRKIIDFLIPHTENSKDIIEENLLSKTIDAETILEHSISFDEAAICVKKGFEQACKISFAKTPTFADVPVLAE